MPATPEVIVVDPAGQTLTVDILDVYNASVTAYTTSGGSTTHSLPLQITTLTSFWLTTDGRYTVSAKFKGVELAGDVIDLDGGVPCEIRPKMNTSAEIEGVSTVPVGVLHLGAASTPTIASGVLTVTSTHVNPLPESGTTDTVDSIVLAGQTAGDVLLVHVPATNTITFDNSATMLLGAGTRAVAPGGSLLLIATSATVWHEVSFLAAAS